MKKNALVYTILCINLLVSSCHGNNNSTKLVGSNKSSTSDCHYNTIMLSIIKSSNFPFGNIDPNKLNILLVDVSDSSILVKVFFETDGTGTLGWAQLNLFDGKLYNTSANLINPQELNYKKDFFNELKKQCPDLFHAVKEKTENKKTVKANIKDFIKNIPQNNLPVSFETIDKLKTVLLPSEYGTFDPSFKKYSEIRIGRIPDYQDKEVLVFNCSFESGYTEIYLGVLDKNVNLISLTFLYFNGAPDGNIENYEYSIFDISEGYNIEITTFKIHENLETGKIIKKIPSKKVLHINGLGEVK